MSQDHNGTLFNPNNAEADDQRPVNYYEQLVGEGKKFKDNESLAKGKWDSDQYIDQLIRERDELKQELGTRVSLQEFLTKKEQLEKENQSTQDNQQNLSHDVDGVSQSSSLQITEQDIDERVNRVLNEKEKQQKEVANFNKVKNVLVEKFGNSYASYLQQKANEMGVTSEYIDQLAKTQPNVLFKLLDVSVSAPNHTSLMVPPVSRNNSDADLMNSKDRGERGKSYWDKVRKEDPVKYFSNQMTRQRIADATRLGDSFYEI